METEGLEDDLDNKDDNIKIKGSQERVRDIRKYRKTRQSTYVSTGNGV